MIVMTTLKHSLACLNTFLTNRTLFLNFFIIIMFCNYSKINPNTLTCILWIKKLINISNFYHLRYNFLWFLAYFFFYSKILISAIIKSYFLKFYILLTYRTFIFMLIILYFKFTKFLINYNKLIIRFTQFIFTFTFKR